jgi:hypothetical protein
MIQQFHFWAYSRELKAGTQRENGTPMFTMALFTIAERWMAGDVGQVVEACLASLRP